MVYVVTLSFTVETETQDSANEAAIKYGEVLTKAGADAVFVNDVCKE